MYISYIHGDAALSFTPVIMSRAMHAPTMAAARSPRT